MKVTYLGTTVLLFDDGKDQLLFDAYLSRQSIFRVGWGKMRTSPETVETVIRKHDMHRLRGIFISHTHLDHVLDLPYIAAKTGAEVYGSPSALNVARGGNIPEKRLQSYQTQRVFRIGDFEVTVLDSLHSKAHWYNNDLGKTIDVPLVQPASRKEYREGGSYDFVVRHGLKTYVIRPSCNYVEGELQGIRADVLYLGIGGLSGCDADFKAHFFRETIQETAPGLVIPIHWDHFFKPLDRISYCCTGVMGNTEASMFELAKYCGEHGISCAVQLPMTCMDDAGLRKPLMDQL